MVSITMSAASYLSGRSRSAASAISASMSTKSRNAASSTAICSASRCPTRPISRAPWFPKGQDLGPQGYFMRYGSDHHAMVLFSKPVMDVRADRKFAPEVTINQITWQCGSLKEITSAHTYFEEQQVAIHRVGRDMPGSNWHVYVYDPDGHTNELYYGIEQIGWNGRAKPRDLHYPGYRGETALALMSEAVGKAAGGEKGKDIVFGH